MKVTVSLGWYKNFRSLTSWKINSQARESYAYNSGTGNLATRQRYESSGQVAAEASPVSLTYDTVTPDHAVRTTTNGDGTSNTYDANGNQITRTIRRLVNGITVTDVFDLAYDAENRVVEVKKNSAVVAQFTYDADGKRVKSVEGGASILFVGSHYEVKGSEISKHYFAGTTRIATRKTTIPQTNTLEYTLTDHLNSTAITTDSAGAKVSELKYTPWGEVRYTWTAEISASLAADSPLNLTNTATLPYSLTRYSYTGQYSDSYINLLWYGFRHYDPALGRFTQPDTIVPEQVQGTQAWDRYAYVNNNPVRYNDPTGHFAETLAFGLGIGFGIGGFGTGLAAAGAATLAFLTSPVVLTVIAVVAIAAIVYVGVQYYNETTAQPNLAAAVNSSSQQASTAEANALLMKGEYVPPILDGYLRQLERKLYGKAVEAYKDAHNLDPNVNLPKDVCDRIAEEILKGVKPENVPDELPEPPDGGYPKKGKPKAKYE